jgi:hypothetical protein
LYQRICGRNEQSELRIARKLSILEPKVQLRNFPSVEQIQDGSFEILPSKLKKFENSLKLPRVLFSISLIIYNHSEGGAIQTQSRKIAEKYFFKCPIKTQLPCSSLTTQSRLRQYRLNTKIAEDGLSCSFALNGIPSFACVIASLGKSSSASAHSRSNRKNGSH